MTGHHRPSTGRDGGSAGAAAGALAAAIVLILLGLPGPALAASADPKAPPGIDPTGVPVAIIGSGIDYRIPEIARRLARDGEGEPIGWDFQDNDDRPFAEAAGCAAPCDAVAYARVAPAGLLVAEASASRLIVLRAADGDARAQASSAIFASRSPARIVAVTTAASGGAAPDWPLLLQAARRFSNLLFIVPAYGPRDALPAPGTRVYGNVIGVETVGEAPGAAAGATPPPAVDIAVAIDTETRPGGAMPERTRAERAALRVTALAARIMAAEPFHDAYALKRRIVGLASAPEAATSAGGPGAAAPRLDAAETMFTPDGRAAPQESRDNK